MLTHFRRCIPDYHSVGGARNPKTGEDIEFASELAALRHMPRGHEPDPPRAFGIRPGGRTVPLEHTDSDCCFWTSTAKLRCTTAARNFCCPDLPPSRTLRSHNFKKVDVSAVGETAALPVVSSHVTRSRASALLLCALALLAGRPASAHFAERTDSLWGFVSRSELVVIGTVVAAQRAEERGHTPLPGAIRLRVDEVLRGRAAAGDVGVLVTGLHQPSYRDRERVLVFAERNGGTNGTLRSIQSRGEKISTDANGTVVAAVRRYAAIAAIADERSRRQRLKDETLRSLASADPRIHADAAFDLNRPGLIDEAIRDEDVTGLERLARNESAPLVVREGIAAKLGLLARSGRRPAVEALARMAAGATNPAARVAAINALAASAAPHAYRTLVPALGARDPYVRLAAAEGLAWLGAREAIPALAELARDPDPRFAFAAVKAIRRIGGTSADAAILEIRSSASPEERQRLGLAAVQTHPSRKESNP
ncbi:MAG: hypothetical protein QOD06_392 [Candidatus Binatota bacterium]|nr:hypothetical protein [Candidatus Binatota bacterium]